MIKPLRIACAIPILLIPLWSNAQIAKGQDKFLGNIYSSVQKKNFATYWNQVTPENAGKWGTVESTRDHMNWSELDAAYKLAKDNGFPFKLHVLIWGNQQPSWIESLSSEEQLEEIKEWFSLVSERYPDIDIVEVVNEPLNDPPSKTGNGGGNYIKALGGNGSSGWDWIINSFKMAREYFPNSKLIMNDYNIIGNTENTKKFIKIINLLQQDSLIDQIGFQAHAFSTTGSATAMKNNLDLLAATGLPIYVTEMDIDGVTDLLQLQNYQRIFPVFWEHPSVKGITLWGWRYGMWRTDEQAFLLYMSTENPRPALIWLQNYVKGTWVPIESISIQSETATNKIDKNKGTLKLNAIIKPDTATIQTVTWIVNKNDLATINDKGLLTAKKNGTVTVTARTNDAEVRKSASFVVTISNQIVAGTEDLDKSDEIKIYPNPITDSRFTIDGNLVGYKTISVYNQNGQIIYQNELNDSEKTDVQLNGIKAGIYIVRLSGNDSKADHRQRIIIE